MIGLAIQEEIVRGYYPMAGFGVVDEPIANVPGEMLEQKVTPAGVSYFALKPEYVGSFGLALNTYIVRTVGTPMPGVDFIEGDKSLQIAPGMATVGSVVGDMRGTRGVVAFQNPHTDPAVELVLTNSVAPFANEEHYVLLEPDGGWGAAPARAGLPEVPGIDVEQLKTRIERASASMRLGSLIGAALGLGAVVYVSRRNR